jgi:hypothetical protein
MASYLHRAQKKLRKQQLFINVTKSIVNTLHKPHLRDVFEVMIPATLELERELFQMSKYEADASLKELTEYIETVFGDSRLGVNIHRNYEESRTNIYVRLPTERT